MISNVGNFDHICLNVQTYANSVAHYGLFTQSTAVSRIEQNFVPKPYIAVDFETCFIISSNLPTSSTKLARIALFVFLASMTCSFPPRHIRNWPGNNKDSYDTVPCNKYLTLICSINYKVNTSISNPIDSHILLVVTGRDNRDISRV